MNFLWGALIITLAAAGTVNGQISGPPMTVTSTDFANGGEIPPRFTCDQENTNPVLQFAAVPAEAKCMVLILDDPDAPAGTFTHWLVWNIPPETKEITSGGLPRQIPQGTNDFGKSGYGGPCPPSGVHRYYFHLYALNTLLKLKPGSDRETVDKAIKGHVIAEATLMGKYGRKQTR